MRPTFVSEEQSFSQVRSFTPPPSLHHVSLYLNNYLVIPSPLAAFIPLSPRVSLIPHSLPFRTLTLDPPPVRSPSVAPLISFPSFLFPHTSSFSLLPTVSPFFFRSAFFLTSLSPLPFFSSF